MKVISIFVCATAVWFIQLSALAHASASSTSDDQHINKLLDGTSNNENVAASTRMVSTSNSLCGCSECTEDIFNKLAGDHSCKDRINHLIDEEGFSQHNACVRVARTEHPVPCGPCDPGRCDGKKLEPEETPSFYCGCPACTPDIWAKMTIDYSCGSRISFLTDIKNYNPEDACSLVAKSQFPLECGPCNPESCKMPSLAMADEREEEEDNNYDESGGTYHLDIFPEEEPDDATEEGGDEYHCGCPECSAHVWNADGEGSSCGERIEYLMQELPHRFPTETSACFQVAFNEFPGVCGACNPGMCEHDDRDNERLTARSELYCFQTFLERTRYRNQFGRFTTEVKEGDLCGPGHNKFTTNTVERIDKHTLKLQYKKVGAQWEASEVRMRLPEKEMPFKYGKYTFSVKSIEVVDSNSEEVVSNELPPSLVLGLFTWDTTDSYAIHENFNHEVDIEISRWNEPTGADVQLLVQPPGDSRMLRFFSGSDGSYAQAPRIYSFDWRPGEIEWSTDIPGGESFTYSTQIARDAGEDDHIQCLPADIEIRLNLWNMFGSSTPTGMEDHWRVEVIIDKVEYEPSGLIGVPDGGVCAKDCQCTPASSCVDNVCVAGSERKLVDEKEQEEPLTEQPKLRRRIDIVHFIALDTVIVLSLVSTLMIVVFRFSWAHKRHDSQTDMLKETASVGLLSA